MSQYDVGGVTTILIRLLTGNKRDGLILVDGKWGTGKTHFMDITFREKYNRSPLFIISVLGLTSLDDFKSALFSESYLKLSADIKEMSATAGSAIALFTQTPAAANPLNQLTASCANAIKKHQLAALTGLFVIDDIERIKPSLATEILAYCHTAYIKNDNLDFIIVSNTAEESSFEIEHKEKIISDTVPFNVMGNDTDLIFEKELLPFGDKYTTILKATLKKQKIDNIRTIRIIIEKLSPIFDFHNKNPEKDININVESMISIFCALTMLSRHHNYTLESIDKPRGKLENKDESGKGILLDAATIPLSALNATPTTYATMKQYAFNLSSSQDIIDAIFKDKKKISIEDIVLSSTPLNYDWEDNDFVCELIAIVRQEKKLLLKIWYCAVLHYRDLVKDKFIPEHDDITNDFLMGIADTYSLEEVVEHFHIEKDCEVTKTELDRLRNEGDIRSYLIKKHSYDERPAILAKMKEDILHNGWSEFNTNIFDELGHRAKYSLFKIIGKDTLIQAITKNWKMKDILAFTDFLRHLYNFENIGDYFSAELPDLKDTSCELDRYLNINTPSPQYGAVLALNNLLLSLIKRLQQQQRN